MTNLKNELHSVLSIAKNVHCYAPEMAILFFLKFTSDNAVQLDVDIPSLGSFNALVDLYSNKTITQIEFIQHCGTIIERTSMSKYGITDRFSRFISTNQEFGEITVLLERIRKMNFSDSASKHAVGDLFLWYLSQDYGWEGQCKSSESISRLITRFAISENTNSIYDCTCGYGILLATAALRCSKNAHVYGQDISENCTIVSAILQWLFFKKNFTIVCDNTVKVPLATSLQIPGKFDAVVAEPPLGIRYDDSDILAFPDNLLAYKPLTQRRGEWVFIQHAIASLSGDGIAVLAVSMGTLFSTGKALEIRKTIINDHKIKAVIELPGGMIHKTSVPSAIIIIDNSDNTDGIFFVSISSPQAKKYIKQVDKSHVVLAASAEDDIYEIITHHTEIAGVSHYATYSEVEEKNYILTPSAYLSIGTVHHSFRDLDEILSSMVQLESELATVNKQIQNTVHLFQTQN